MNLHDRYRVSKRTPTSGLLNVNWGARRGSWKERYWKNIPGPFYSTTINMMSLNATRKDPYHILHDNDCEFVWRQPLTDEEIAVCVKAMESDEVESFEGDGNRRWDLGLIRAWWARRHELKEWARKRLDLCRDDPEAFRDGDKDAADHDLLREYIRYLGEDAEHYLASYAFLLQNGRIPEEGDEVPGLAHQS